MQDQVNARIDDLTEAAQTALTGAQASAADAKQSATASSVLVNNLAQSPGAGLVGFDIENSYNVGTVGDKLRRWVDVEDFKDASASAGDWSGAINTAIASALAVGNTDVRGEGAYKISSPILVQNASSKGLRLMLNSLGVNEGFPANTSFWDATAMIQVGDMVGNISGLDIRIQTLDGGGKANGVEATGYGYSLSEVHIGDARNCIRVMSQGKHQWPNASNKVFGDFWTDNWLGIYLSDGTGSNAPITEGWHIDVKFIAANYWGSVWYQRSGRYGRLGGDHDFNGQRLSILTLSDTTGLDQIWDSQQLQLTNGTETAEFLFYYYDKGLFYVVMAHDRVVSTIDGSATGWTVGDTLSCPTVSGVAIKIGAISVCRDNASGTNYFDILHNFDRTAFAKVQMMMGYCSGVIGGYKFSSFISYQNSFRGDTDQLRGLSITCSPTILTLGNAAISDNPWISMAADFLAFQNRVYTGARLIDGGRSLATITASSTEWTSVMGLADSGLDKVADEGSKWKIDIISNYFGAGMLLEVWAKGSDVNVIGKTRLNTSFGARVVKTTDSSGNVTNSLQLRQEAQPTMNFMILITRI
ncbi:hypothetical protein LLQ46_00550 [Rouxiella badensis]|uniref:hypothetical protein n=1 Tax=Rouxiella badensis TaxID=1646377 RepID=UPI001D15A0A7|nr:hypothetical protein [Rouxiella badensis]MCC3745337.1 hypothetical protein [Rouxiella badensis]